MADTRVIKKYPNRRLYDTEESRYIRLADVRNLVLEDVAFVVIDKKTGNDITRSILLQVIAEDEQRREPIMSRAFLSQVIRAPERIPAAATAAYLEQCLDSYLGRERPAVHTVAHPVTQVHRGRWNAVHEDGPGQRGGEAEVDAYAEDRKQVG